MPQGRFTLFAAACLALTASAAVADWTRFRGPNGSGVAEGDVKDIPVKWTDKNILWKVPIPGVGHSSPILWKDQLYVQTASKDGSERSLVCIDIKDGSTKWSRPMPYKAAKANLKKGEKLINALNSYASSSCAVDADHVYTVFWDNVKLYLHAYTHKGDPVWSKDLGTFTSQHGPGASPVVVGDKVIFANDQDGKAVLLAFDARTGKLAWSKDRPAYRACYSAPLVRERPDGKGLELIVVSSMGVTGYDPDTGDKHWNWEWKFAAKPLRTAGTPVLANGMLFASSGDSENGPRHAVAVKLDATPTLAWENRKEFPYVPSLLVHGKYVYFVNDAGRAGCFDAETGKRIWYESLDGRFYSSPILIDGKIYAANTDGDVFVLAASPTFQLLAKNSLDEPIEATPAVADNRLYIRGANHLWCIGKAK
jgi:outer membrane protein assembly factor BamB